MELIFLLLFWVGLSAGVGALWQSRGHGFAGGLLCSIFLSPLIGFIIGIAMRPNVRVIEGQQVSEGGMKKCPYCAEVVKREAIICRYCGKELKEEKSIVKGSKSGKFFFCPYCNQGLRSANVVECPKCHGKLLVERKQKET